MLPNTYWQLEYIESSGTQYIDINYFANATSKIWLKTMCTSTSTANAWTQITGAKSDYHAPNAIQAAFNTSSNLVPIDYGTAGQGDEVISKNIEFEIKIGPNGYTSINGISKPQQGTFSGTSPYSLWIFDCNAVGSHESYYTGRIYWYKIFENELLIRDFIPAKRKSDDVIGLYDLVNDQFYINAGSGTFTHGKIVDLPLNIEFTDNPLSIYIDQDIDLAANFERTSSVRIKINGQWKYGMPYIKVNGVWKPGIAYLKSNNSWKEGL